MDDLMKYMQGVIAQGRASAASGIQDAQNTVTQLLGIGQADAMSPQAQLRYKEATEVPAEPEIIPPTGQVNLANQPSPAKIEEAYKLREAMRQRILREQR